MKEKHVLRTRGKGQQSQEEEVVMFLASMSLAEQDVFFSWLAGTLDCPCFYHYFSKKPKTHWMLVQGLGLACASRKKLFPGWLLGSESHLATCRSSSSLARLDLLACTEKGPASHGLQSETAKLAFYSCCCPRNLKS